MDEKKFRIKATMRITVECKTSLVNKFNADVTVDTRTLWLLERAYKL